jgi:hypothetical protein
MAHFEYSMTSHAKFHVVIIFVHVMQVPASYLAWENLVALSEVIPMSNAMRI